MIFDFGIEEKKFNSYADLGLKMVLNVLQGKESLAVVEHNGVQTLIKSIIAIIPNVEISYLNFDDCDEYDWFYVVLDKATGLSVEYATAMQANGIVCLKTTYPDIAYIDENFDMLSMDEIHAKNYYFVVIDKSTPIINKRNDSGKTLSEILEVLRASVPYEKFIEENSI